MTEEFDRHHEPPASVLTVKAVHEDRYNFKYLARAGDGGGWSLTPYEDGVPESGMAWFHLSGFQSDEKFVPVRYAHGFEVGDLVKFQSRNEGWFVAEITELTSQSVTGKLHSKGTSLVYTARDEAEEYGPIALARTENTDHLSLYVEAKTPEFKPGDKVRGISAYGPESQVEGTVLDPTYFTDRSTREKYLRVNTTTDYDLRHVKNAVLITDTKEEDKTVTQKLVGPKPEVQAPAFTTPFTAHGGSIKDANENYVLGVSGDQSDEDEDAALAEVVKDLLNEKFGAESKTPEFDPPHGRVLVVVEDGRVQGQIVYGDIFAYEVQPGKFWFAGSLEKAIRESARGPWALTSRNAPEYVDVRTGKTPIV